jgi:hypothetical protein
LVSGVPGNDLPGAAGTVPLRVQVIDRQPRLVDLVVPTYLGAEDLTARMARDVGLGGWWEDGSRRRFTLRARGRDLAPGERLEDLGIVPYELVYLLPEPRRGDPVVERPPGVVWPDRTPYRGRDLVDASLRWAGWAVLWAFAVSVEPTAAVAWCGGFGAAWTATRLAGVLADGHPSRAPGWIALGATLVAASAPLTLGVLGGWLAGDTAAADAFGLPTPVPVAPWRFAALTVLGASTSGWLGRLVWLGPVAAPDQGLPVASADAEQVAAERGTCGICGRDVADDVAAACRQACGRVFHRGCLAAREAVATAAGCAVCGRPA